MVGKKKNEFNFYFPLCWALWHLCFKYYAFFNNYNQHQSWNYSDTNFSGQWGKWKFHCYDIYNRNM